MQPVVVGVGHGGVHRKVTTPLSLTLDDLRAMPQREVHLPITCVRGWSATGRWRGVWMADVLAAAGAQQLARLSPLHAELSPAGQGLVDDAIALGRT
jgi:DMSO/TMAO reductase YedYZ molybdopterin-dependent catalytic subunit